MVAMEVINDDNSKKNSRDVASQIMNRVNNAIALNSTVSDQILGTEATLLEMQREQLEEIKKLISSF